MSTHSTTGTTGTTETARLAGLAGRLRDLHHGELLVLPNAWDAASARVVVEAGFPVVATSSAAVAESLGYDDGQAAPWSEMLAAAARIARAVPVPVTVDAEAGYGLEPAALVARLLEGGLVGCNLEDTDHRTGGLLDAEAHAGWLAGVREAADATGVPLVLNARVDVFLPTSPVAEPDRVAEALRRGRLYREAGVDCVYPIGVRSAETLAALVDGLGCSVNGNPGPGLDLARLRELGVARASYGPRFHRTAMAELATALRALR